VTAFIVPREGHQIDPVALRTYLKTRLTAFKVPKAYIAVDEMPKSGAGKVLKREIRRQYGGDVS
jgi:acyl-CoA synthetase (AMP-forming)/AMP-acid ligase II